MAREREDHDGRDAHPLLVPYVVLAHVVILTVVFWSVYKSQFSDVPIYYDYASKVLAGRVPYRDFAMEYPPGALIFFALPRLISHTITQYYAAFRVEVILFDVSIVLALNAIARRAGVDRFAVLIAYTVFVLTVGPIIGQDFDIFPAAMVVFALLFAARGEYSATAIMLGLGTMTKLYPLLLAPAFAMPLIRRRSYIVVLRAATVACATMLLVVLPLLLVAAGDLPSFLRYHAARGIHVESTYGGVLVVADKLHIATTRIQYNFASWNVNGAAADVVKPLSTLVLLIALVAVYLAMYRQTRDDGAHTAAEDITSCTDWSTLILATLLVTSKVLSPQYLIWLMPLVPLLTVSTRRAVWIAFGLAGMLTYYVFPRHYMALVVHASNDTVAALLARNLLLVVMTILLYRGLCRDQRATRTEVTEP